MVLLACGGSSASSDGVQHCSSITCSKTTAEMAGCSIACNATVVEANEACDALDLEKGSQHLGLDLLSETMEREERKGAEGAIGSIFWKAHGVVIFLEMVGTWYAGPHVHVPDERSGRR